MSRSSDDTPARTATYSKRWFTGRTLVLAAFAALGWWAFTDTPMGGGQGSGVLIIVLLVHGLSFMQATILAYALTIAVSVAAAWLLAWSLDLSLIAPTLLGALAGAINGLGGRENKARARREANRTGL